MWEKGLTQNALDVFERISKLDCVKDFHLCGTTGIALQLNHRVCDSLDFELLTVQDGNDKSKILDQARIIKELKSEFGTVIKEDGATDNHLACYVGEHVKLSFNKSQYKVPALNEVNILNNLKSVSLQDLLGMKLFDLTKRFKFRDYYDIYSLLKGGCSLEDAILYTVKFSRYENKSGYIISALLLKEVYDDSAKEEPFDYVELKAKYKVNAYRIYKFIESKLLSDVRIENLKRGLAMPKPIGKLFYETIMNLDDARLFHIMDRLPVFEGLQTAEDKINFLKELLSSVGVNAVPYDYTNPYLLEVRKGKDIKSLSRIDEILSERTTYQMLNAELKKQYDLIKATKELQIEDSIKATLVATCNTRIEDLKNQQRNDLRHFWEFEGAERWEKKIKINLLGFSEAGNNMK